MSQTYPPSHRQPDSHRVLLVDRSPIVRELVTLHLRSRGFDADGVPTPQEAVERIQARAPGYVVLESAGGGMDLLHEIGEMPDPRPHVIVTSLRPDLEEETRASMHGAIAYLKKPLNLSDLSRAMGAWPLVFRPSVAPRACRASVARAMLCDPDYGNAAVLECDVHDLSQSGAFLLTRAPIAPGRPLRLMLRIGDAHHAVRATVVRVQEPSWEGPAGVGVEFGPVPEAMRRAIAWLVRD